MLKDPVERSRIFLFCRGNSIAASSVRSSVIFRRRGWTKQKQNRLYVQ
jgi:hypothetical protein